jgi:hypothetical protein
MCSARERFDIKAASDQQAPQCFADFDIVVDDSDQRLLRDSHHGGIKILTALVGATHLLQHFEKSRKAGSGNDHRIISPAGLFNHAQKAATMIVLQQENKRFAFNLEFGGSDTSGMFDVNCWFAELFTFHLWGQGF